MDCGSFSAKGTRLAHRIKGPMEGGHIYHKILDENILLTPQSSSRYAKTVWRHNSVPDYFGYYGNS